MSVGMEQDQSTLQPKVILNPTAQAVTFFPGLYLFTVRAATPLQIPDAGGLLFPALLVAAGPGQAPGSIEFVGNPAAVSVWLFNVGDSAVIRVSGRDGATLLLNSIRVAGDTQAFDIQVDRLDAQQVAGSPAAAEPTAPAAPALPSLKLKLGLHLLRQGDVDFVDAEWAGRAGSGVWIESFSIVPLEEISAAEIEYKGLAANGFETPWLSDGASCGTRGVNIPLIGFAIRLKGSSAQIHDCEYSAVFRSGTVVGPSRNGVPCRSKVANDPLDAIQVRIVKRQKPGAAVMSPELRAAVGAVSQDRATKGPSFGKFREDAAGASKAVGKASKSAPASATKPEKAEATPAKLPGKPGGGRK